MHKAIYLLLTTHHPTPRR